MVREGVASSGFSSLAAATSGVGDDPFASCLDVMATMVALGQQLSYLVEPARFEGRRRSTATNGGGHLAAYSRNPSRRRRKRPPSRGREEIGRASCRGRGVEAGDA